MAVQLWKHMPGKALMFLLNLFTAIALIFEGYNQGVLGTVSTTPGFIDMADIGSNGVVTNSTKQGGLLAAYYFGAMCGCFIGGWVGDKLGRKKGVWLGSLFCMLGAAIMSASQNSNMFICARVIAGIGIGFINTTVPPSSEVEFRWCFLLAFMAVPVLIVVLTVFFLPESLRWLMANNRREEAVNILGKIRGDLDFDDSKLLVEVQQLEATVEASYHERNNFFNLVRGGRYSGKLHLGRRVVMGLAIQQIQQLTGILTIATWAGTLFSLAGFDSYKSAWLAGVVNSFGILGIAAASLVIDRPRAKFSLSAGLFVADKDKTQCLSATDEIIVLMANPMHHNILIAKANTESQNMV
ncbi:uncharacterized protein N7498_004487 [Penicillium cinerascens]|uniref:Major facilitator superfamily (MFS) profile domain-containing protein n=1 Tax=Penicillium cinerascens TaxID=70096 RepID=A0A9W9MLQ2_9EURO|nr:uncharacterized protein N7498_004487 [Penicillium cinerascens]KAJ5203608.1 hypothetical protein N7498_004487 [Penicillium cinerascens]